MLLVQFNEIHMYPYFLECKAYGTLTVKGINTICYDFKSRNKMLNQICKETKMSFLQSSLVVKVQH